MPITDRALDMAGAFSHVEQRITSKMQDYRLYAFGAHQTCAFNVFFDLAQELETVEEIYVLALLTLKSFFGLESALFIETSSNGLELHCSSDPAGCGLCITDLAAIQPEGSPCVIQQHLCLPVRGKPADTATPSASHTGNRLGVLVIKQTEPIPPEQVLYLEKFANRLGFQLHNRLLFIKNSQHIRFINGLVHDVGHNVIVPNMYFSLLFHQLDGKIRMLSETVEEMSTLPTADMGFADIFQKLNHARDNLNEHYQEIYRHFQQVSLFLETLLRQSHFEKGHYVLQCTQLDFCSRIMLPQLERFRGRLEKKGIALHEERPCTSSPILVFADLGLISQVLANLLSNAAKYTRSIYRNEVAEQYVKCAVRSISEYFTNKKDGVRVDVFTTGPVIDQNDVPNLFTADFRGSNTGQEYGTGHGLYFIREIVELHGGEVGYEAHPHGNTFFFVLPMAS